jgi:hypothetical protein
MPAQLNHTIVNVRDSSESAGFVSEVLGLPSPTTFGPFLCVETANGVTLDFIDSDEEIEPQHYAFLISEAEFDEIFGRILERGVEHWADPARQTAREINHHDGGRGVYFVEPSGHFLEIITRPYGTGS